MPHLYSISTVFELHDNLNSLVTSNDGEMQWAVGELGAIVKSPDGGAHWATVASGTTKPLNSIVVSADGLTLWTGGFGRERALLNFGRHPRLRLIHSSKPGGCLIRRR